MLLNNQNTPVILSLQDEQVCREGKETLEKEERGIPLARSVTKQHNESKRPTRDFYGWVIPYPTPKKDNAS